MRTVYGDLDASYLEHRRCSEFDGGVDENAPVQPTTSHTVATSQ
jgi:hypothetical protein